MPRVAGSETLAARAFDVARRIDALPDEAFALYGGDDAPTETARKLKSWATAIVYDILPVVLWMERKWPERTTVLFKRRLYAFARYVGRLARLDDYPEARPDWKKPKHHRPSAAAVTLIELSGFAPGFAAQVRSAGNDIEQDSIEGAGGELDRALWNQLNDRQRNALRALYEGEAFDADRRIRTKDLIDPAVGPGRSSVDSFKRPLSELVKLGLLSSVVARGGYWLTPRGRKIVEALSD